MVWWMANRQSFCFIVAFHDFVTLKNRLTYQCLGSWPVVITMKKKISRHLKKNLQDIGQSKLMAASLQPVKAWKKKGKYCEGANFSWLSSKVSRTLALPAGIPNSSTKQLVGLTWARKLRGAWWKNLGPYMCPISGRSSQGSFTLYYGFGSIVHVQFENVKDMTSNSPSF
jgi:hypothetical protein